MTLDKFIEKLEAIGTEKGFDLPVIIEDGDDRGLYSRMDFEITVVQNVAGEWGIVIK